MGEISIGLLFYQFNILLILIYSVSSSLTVVVANQEQRIKHTNLWYKWNEMIAFLKYFLFHISLNNIQTDKMQATKQHTLSVL